MSRLFLVAENLLERHVGAEDGGNPKDSRKGYLRVCDCHNKKCAYHHQAVGDLEKAQALSPIRQQSFVRCRAALSA